MIRALSKDEQSKARAARNEANKAIKQHNDAKVKTLYRQHLLVDPLGSRDIPVIVYVGGQGSMVMDHSILRRIILRLPKSRWRVSFDAKTTGRAGLIFTYVNAKKIKNRGKITLYAYSDDQIKFLDLNKLPYVQIDPSTYLPVAQ